MPDWGRLMFFRCGDLIVEITHRPGKPAAGAQGRVQDRLHDRLRGLCWRVTDIDATHARLMAGGVDVSEVRTGRKPGTRVMTVRSGTCGVPTLLVQPSVKPEGRQRRTLRRAHRSGFEARMVGTLTLCPPYIPNPRGACYIG